MQKFNLAAFRRAAACVLLFSGAVGWAGAAAAQPAPATAAGEAAPAKPALPESFSMHPVKANVDVSDARRLDADSDLDNWLLNGCTYDNQRFSHLTQVNAANVDKLKPVALIQTGVQNSFKDTPIVVDGIMYVETAFNHIMAYDAAGSGISVGEGCHAHAVAEGLMDDPPILFLRLRGQNSQAEGGHKEDKRHFHAGT